MANILFLVALTLSTSASFASEKVIYGDDNRLDVLGVTNVLHKRLALSTAAMVENKKIQKDTSGNCRLNFNETLETGANVCPGEAFSQQSIGAMCSGFLVGDDVLVTAGHCFKLLGGMGYPTAESVCKGFSWVFNYAVDSTNRDPRAGKTSDVYGCKQVVTATLSNTQDFAVIKLDRKVTGRVALKFRESGKIADRASLVVIGHPSGLPSKIAAGARVLKNTDSGTFVTNLDTFHGNSGSAVFDATTGQLEGILIQGQTDYRPSDDRDFRSCQVVNRCEENGNGCVLPTMQPGAPKGEVVTRIAQVVSFIKAARVPARTPARR